MDWPLVVVISFVVFTGAFTLWLVAVRIRKLRIEVDTPYGRGTITAGPSDEDGHKHLKASDGDRW